MDLINGSIIGSALLKIRKAFQAVVFGSVWSIWKWRNAIVHANEMEKRKLLNQDIFHQIQSTTFLWLMKRGRFHGDNWEQWVRYPDEAFQFPEIPARGKG